MKLGLVLAISDYAHPLSALPGCATDAAVLRTVLSSQEDIQDILIVDDDTGSASVKNRLTQFVKKYQGTQIDQLILYYTGHGLFQGNEFFYLLSDYDSSRQRQTSLQNTELDGLLRSLSPRVTVKIIDACQSGIQYIKDQNSVDQYLKGTQDSFRSCYFLFSSRNTESSYQNSMLSDFTKVIAEGIEKHQAHTIRYKDIIDYASDSFSRNNIQTPFFVTQADFTDIFCAITDDLRGKLRGILKGHKKAEAIAATTLHENSVPATTSTLKAHVEMEAREFCTKDEAIARISDFRHELEKAQAEGEVATFYEISVTVSDTYKGLPSFSKVGEWFEEHEHDFFAETETESRRRKRFNMFDSKKNFFDNQMQRYNIYGLNDSELETYYVTTGVKSTVELPYCYLTLHAAARYPNIRSKSIILLPLVSRTRMLIFSCSADYEQKGWDGEEMISQVKWQHRKVPLKDPESIRAIVHNTLLSPFWRSLIEPVVERFHSGPSPAQYTEESNKSIESDN